MRHPLLVLLGFCCAWAVSSFAADANGTVDENAVSSRVADARVEKVRSFAPRSDGGAWIAAGDALWSRSQHGQLHREIDMVRRGFGRPDLLAANIYDDSVWVATDGLLLLHFARDGVLAQGTTLPAKAGAMAVDLDESIWIAADDRLLHFSPDGRWLRTQPLDLVDDERATALAVDALRDRIWIATTGGVHLLARQSLLEERIVRRGDAGARALAPRTGIILAIVDATLVVVDADHLASTESILADEDEHALTIVYDAADSSFTADTNRARLRIAPDGTVLEREAAHIGTLPAATPFRLDPTLTLLRPPGGGAMYDSAAEIIVRTGALCNGGRCDVPPDYLQQMRVDAALDGVALGAPIIDGTGRATFPLRPPMRVGMNELSASATDVFGHRATLGHARWTLIADDDALPSDSPSEAQTSVWIDKAANKAPTVALTAPANGTVFSAASAIQLSASASDADGTIAKVEFYRGGTTLIGAAATAPYQYVWTNVPAGSYSLTAKAYDNRNGTAVSAAVTIVVTDNQLPSVTLVSPEAGSFVRLGEQVALEAAASDGDGTIASVEFFDGSVSLGMSRSQPYRLSWSPTSPGVHMIRARATDDRRATSESSTIDVVVGDAPVVVVTSPAACSTVDGPVNVMMRAEAISATGAIASVEFFDNGISVGTARTAPWQAMLANASIGNHAITAKATDDHGVTQSSRPATFTLRGQNQPPMVALTAPDDGARLPFRATVNLAATASDADGAITAVEFRIGSTSGTLIGRTSLAPYAAAWTNVAAGSYAIVAVAYDDRNATTTSAPVHITVNPNVAPIVSITTPAANSRFVVPTNVTVTATASDSDGTIGKVDFYSDATLIGSSTTAPYSVLWNAGTPGTYSLTAKATDDSGGVTTSAAVPIIAVSNALPSVVLTATAPGGNYYAPATLVLSADAQDSDGSIASVDFYANGAPIGHAGALPYRAVWDGVVAGTYVLTAKATDDAGGVATSSPVSVNIITGPSITIDPALSGATIDDDNVLIRGVVSAPANAAVTVNGIVTHIDDVGRFSANDVGLSPGSNTVRVEVTTQDGQSSSQSIVVNSSGAGAFVVQASPTEGLESLDVTFTIENPTNTPFTQMLLDLDNDGFPNLILMPNQFVDGKLTVTATYPEGTWLAVLKAYDDQDRVIYSTTKSIVVRIPQILQANLRAIYDGMLTRLKAGNIAGALTAFTGSAYSKYNEIFTQLQSSLGEVVDQLGEVSQMTFNENVAELTVARNTPDGPLTFFIYFLRSEDGIWRIDAM